nr:transporter substrate-binding domain-containing protein [uncultured Undibacterium sp.]
MKRFLTALFLICSCSMMNNVYALIADAVSVGKNKSTATPILTVYVQERLDAKGRPQPVRVGLRNVLHYLEQNTDMRLIAVSVPWNRAKQMTLDGKDIIWGFSKSPERLTRYRYSEALLSSRIWAIAYGEPQISLNSVEDLNNKTVSIERGVSHGMEFELAKNKVFKIDEDSAQASARFRKLIAKRSDVLLWGLIQFDKQDQFLTYLHQTYIPDLRDPELLGKTFYASKTPLFYDTIHFASAKGQFEKEMQQIDIAIKRGFKTGELTKLIKVLN